MKKQAFTLVELIVVITILSILGTIAFVSLQGYSSSARDSIRLTDLQNIEKGLEFMSLKSGRVSIPDDKVDISASGTVISYQGYAGKNVLSQIGISNGGLDPLDQTYYTYATNAALSRYQLLGYLESGEEISFNNTNQVHADLTNRYPIIKGSSIGIIVNPTTKEPLQTTGTGVDIVTTINQYKVYISSSDASTGTGNILAQALYHRINEKGSCNTLLLNGYSKGNGIYKINPTGISEFDAYCEMTSIGGGWTLLASIPGDSVTFGSLSTTGIWEVPNYDFTIPNSLKNQEFLSRAYEDLDTSEILLCYKNTSTCYNFRHNKNIPFFHFFRDNISYVEYSYNLVGYGEQGDVTSRNNFFTTFGVTTSSYGTCGFLGINPMNSSNRTSGIIGYGGDNDGPCITVNNSSASILDNYTFGISGYLRHTYPGSTGLNVSITSLAGYQKYNMPDSVLVSSSGPSVYLSKDWHILGK